VQGERRSDRATVVVVHGLWMTGAVLALQRLWLARRGYRVAAFSYPSMRVGLDEIASRLARFVTRLDVANAHFLGHSLGGLVVLNMLALEAQARAGRVVLLASPVGGSRAAAQIGQSSVGRMLVGPALDWRPERGASVAARFEIGMIAGTARFGMGRFLARLPQPNDGVICLDETRLPGLRDHLTLPLSHSAILVSARVARQIHSFLESGHFAR
jgi:pimeloyl-ACP methyl ester carboxylesterase